MEMPDINSRNMKYCYVQQRLMALSEIELLTETRDGDREGEGERKGRDKNIEIA